MLCLTRKPGEEIRIGDDITIVVVATSNGRVRLGIQAPQHVHIVRSELIVEPAPQPTVESHAPLVELACDAA